MTPTLGDICAVACAEQFRGDGEIVASGFSAMAAIAIRFARATFSPALLVARDSYFDGEDGPGEGPVRDAESVCTFADMLTIAFSGRRHVLMGANQLDRFGNQNISNLGSWKRPTVQWAGFRGGPLNTIHQTVSYWVPRHSPRVFVPQVDVVTGVGENRARQLGAAGRFRSIRGVVTNLAVLELAEEQGMLTVRSVHPGVDAAQVQHETGFDLGIDRTPLATRLPSDEEIAVLDRIDPGRVRDAEVQR